MDNFVTYLESLAHINDPTQPTLKNDLSSILQQVKMREAEKISDKGIESQVKYLYAQGWRYDDILIELGLTPEQAHYLIMDKDLFHPRVKDLRTFIATKRSQGFHIGKLVSSETGEVLDLGFITPKVPEYNNQLTRHLDPKTGYVLNCKRTRVNKFDLLWFQNEKWWHTAKIVPLVA